ncbi:MAG: hypothetical protein ACYDH9_20285 [Limisphaerales bacterium]
MLSEIKLVRFQWGLLAAWLVLFLVYAVGYRMMSQRAAELDQPLALAWKKLADRTRGHEAMVGGDIAAMNLSLQQITNSLATLRQAGQLARERVVMDHETLARLQEPFQLLDFDKNRLQLIADLRRLAAAKQVALEPTVTDGYPEFSTSLAQPALLWVQLAIVHRVMATAVLSGPRVLTTATSLPVRSHAMAGDGQELLEEFPVRIELAGSAEALLRFLQVLPLRSAELNEMGYDELPFPKQALFVDRFVLKNTAGPQNEAHLDVIVSGFLFREEPL